ncbi:MAG: tetratricopeptide repeat protein [Cyanobacteria bacterium SZAS-4]|nr:tetratricopeptide repeat protein [Cyanobacteria bacterium SZAS-4]
MNPLVAKSITVSFLLISLLAFAEQAKSQTGERYEMDGKPVSRAFYEAGLLVTDANNLLRANRNQEASVKLKQAIAVAPDYAEAHYNYGLSMAKLGNSSLAVEQFHTAIKLNPNLDQCWISLGGVYQSAGQIEDAIQSYKQFLTRFPRSAQASQVSNLVKGLQNELGSGSAKPDAQGFGASAPAKAAADDYLADVTKRGTLRWPSDHHVIRVYMRPPVNVTGYLPRYDAIARQSFTDWANASGGALKFQFQSIPTNADIEFSWISDASKLVNKAEAGETRLTCGKFGIVHGTVRILTVPLMSGIAVTPNRIRLISLHEIGHVLGLTGHTSNPNDAMFYSATIGDEWRNLSPRDINTMTRLYAPATASVNNGP